MRNMLQALIFLKNNSTLSKRVIEAGLERVAAGAAGRPLRPKHCVQLGRAGRTVETRVDTEIARPLRYVWVYINSLYVA